MSRELLFEVGCEEIPAAPLDRALAQFADDADRMFEALRISHGEMRILGTPRRLVLYVREVAERQDALTERRRGPAAKAAFGEDGAPTRAAIGFGAASGVPVDSLTVGEDGQGEYVYAVIEHPGSPSAEVLPAALAQLVVGLSFAKPMRWGASALKFVRPIRWLVALFGDDVLPVELDGIEAGRVTFGHRFLGPGPFEVTSGRHYLEVVAAQGKVVLDQRDRAAVLREAVQSAAQARGWRAVMDDPPFSEVVNLVETPGVALGSFPESFAALPRPVLVTAMESHQRYFPVETADGAIAAGFVVVHNGDPDSADMIVRGHERVLAARLADAEFFFEEDRKATLSSRVDALKRLVFQERLGTVHEKVTRVQGIAHFLARAVGAGSEIRSSIERAALLSKADLVTSMVVEFPTLQGVMGREYALLDGEPEVVADAIFEHYLPRSASDELPASLVGQVVSMADKIDTIVGCFSLGLVPSGSEDPYGLRRQGLGIVRIAIEKRLKVSLAELLEAAISHYGTVLHNLDLDGVPACVADFMLERLKSYELSRGYRYDRIDAVIAGGVDDFVGAHDRVAAISDFLATPGAPDLMVGFTRAANLSQPDLGAATDPALMGPAELELLDAVQSTHQASQQALTDADYPAALSALAQLRGPIDHFFVDVLVMDPEEKVRANRLRLLNRLVSVFSEIADFKKIVQDQ